MNSIEKKKQIKKFLEGKIKIIISTTVIEVGIDIPNASVILVENANFFGLSQLHQLRGRVGRGCYPSYCILITNKEINLNSYKKIKEICKTNKGLNLSKKDLEIRGGGDLIYDTKQSGKKNINVLDFPIIDYKLMRRAIILANIFFEKNPEYLKLNNFYFLKKGKFIP